MGNIISDNLLFCFCGENIVSIEISLENTTSEKCDIILNKQAEINGFRLNEKIKIFDGVCKKYWTEKFLILINQIISNSNNFTKKNINRAKDSFGNILNEFLKRDEQELYLKNFDGVNKKNDLKTIKNFIDLFKLIYDNKKKIKDESIIYMIKSINYCLKNDNILDKNQLEFFINNLKEIYLLGIKFRVEKINNIEYSEIESRYKEEIDMNTHFDIKSLKSKSSKSSYTNNSQSKINKMEEEIKDLKSYIENSILKTDKVKYINIKFLDEKLKEEFPLKIYLNYNDKFSSLIDKFYEKYPDYEERGIKRFIINGKAIKRNEIIEDIKLNDSDKILVEY